LPSSPPERLEFLASLETARLRLRPLRLEDAFQIFEYASDPEVSRFLTWSPHQTMEDTYAFLRRVIEGYMKGILADWGIEEKASGRLIGSGGFVAWNTDHACGEIGYVLGREAWGQGYATEAARAMLGFGFAALRLNRVEAYCLPGNAASARVLEKIGMRREGLLRQARRFKNAFHDLYLYAILRADWDAGQGGQFNGGASTK